MAPARYPKGALFCYQRPLSHLQSLRALQELITHFDHMEISILTYCLHFLYAVRESFFLFFLSNIKSYRDKVLKHYDLLDYNTKTEPRGSKYHDYPLGLNVVLNTTDNTKLHINTRSHFTFDAMVKWLLWLLLERILLDLALICNLIRIFI